MKKVNSVLDREPKNYSNLSSFPNFSNVAEIVQFFHVFVNLISYSAELKDKIGMHKINLFLSMSKNISCAKSIHFLLRRKIKHA